MGCRHSRSAAAMLPEADPWAMFFNIIILNAGYRVERIQAVDMFPHTDHIETIVRLRRRALLRSKRGDRINTARAARGQVTRDARHSEHAAGDDDPRWTIERPDTEQHGRKKSRNRKGA